MTAIEILDCLNTMFPSAKCELNYSTPFQLAVAVILSAQTTDVSVNKVTPFLFQKYPDAKSMSKAEIKELEECIHSIGLYHNKAKSLKKLSEELIERFHGEIPSTMDELTSLSGIGRKSANVILSECFGVPSLAVDTHVYRISRRLGFSTKEDDVTKTEEKLKKAIPKDRWIQSHHLFIFFGRYRCLARKPGCKDCPFIDFCTEENKNIQ